MALKPRVRVKAGSVHDPKPLTAAPVPTTRDSFVNFAAKLGIGAGNLSDASGYNFNFITHQRIGLEAAYRGSWLMGAAVDYPAEDMTNGGIEMNSTLTPADVDTIEAALRDLFIWQRLGATIKWARLYGGSVALMLIDGQKMETPLNVESIGKDQFKGLFVLDRWMLNPSVGELITDIGPDLGMPKFYQVIAANQLGVPAWKIHHSRLLRMDGIELPYGQKIMENFWSMSVIERIFDRIVSFDSSTAGAAQLVFKAYLRTYKIPKLRELIAAGGPLLEAVTKQVDFIRMMQSNEGLTIIDSEDEFDALEYSFAGLDKILEQFAGQLAGALEIPIVRLFGQSPAGLNSTGESDLRTYYDGIVKKQNTTLRRPLTTLLEVVSRSKLNRALPEGFNFEFKSLWQPSPAERAEIANKRTQAVVGAYDSQVIERTTALEELRAMSGETGMWTNIGDEEIAEAEADPPISDHLENELEPPEPKIIQGPGAPKPAAVKAAA